MDKRESAFRLLDQELAREGLSLTVLCVGGYVLEYHGLRATHDVDAFYNSSRKVQEIIYHVGQVLNLNYRGELWLNNDVSSLNKQPPIDLCEPLYSFGNLTVLVVPIEYVLGMKMLSLRDYDLDDITSIIKYKRLRSPFQLYKRLKKFGFDTIDFSVLLEGFGLAYGFEWLDHFYVENEAKLEGYF